MMLSELIRFDRKGLVLGKIGPPARYDGVTALEDGARLAISRSDGPEPQHTHIVELARGVFSRLNPGTASDYASAPAPDHTLAYTSSPEGVSRDLYVRAANGVGEARLLVSSDHVKHANDWSPDGRFLIYDEHVLGRAQDLLLVRRDGGAPIPFLATDADETFAQFSPDGKWLAYRSTESGRPEVYVRDFAPDRTPPVRNREDTDFSRGWRQAPMEPRRPRDVLRAGRHADGGVHRAGQAAHRQRSSQAV